MRARSPTLASDTTIGGAERRAAGSSSRAGTAMAVALIALAAAIRLSTLGEQSLWLDEGYTERLVRMSLGAMLHAIPRTESTPPVYYVVAWGWARVAGFSAFGLRSLSAVAGIGTIPVVYAAADRIAGRVAAALAGLLAAVSPLMVWFSQEARAYALVTLLAAATVLCTIGWLQTGRTPGRRRRGWLIGWAVAAGAGLATHYFVAFAVAPEVALMWMRTLARRRVDRGLATATAAVGAVACALIPLALAQRGTGHADYIGHGDLATRLAQIPKQFLVGYASPHQGLTAALAAALVLAGAALPIVARPDVRARAMAPLAVGIAGVLLPVALALAGVDFLDTRNLLPMLPALLIAAGAGFAGVRRGPALAVALAAVSLAVVALVDAEPRYQRADWRDAAAALGAARGPRALAVTPGSGLIPLQAYLPGLSSLTGAVRVRELDVIALGAQSTGGGIGRPPRPGGPPPAAFHLVKAVYGATYTALRYAAAGPVTVTPAVVAAAGLRRGDVAVLLQRGGP